jgi:hypothetical protein
MLARRSARVPTKRPPRWTLRKRAAQGVLPAARWSSYKVPATGVSQPNHKRGNPAMICGVQGVS